MASDDAAGDSGYWLAFDVGGTFIDILSFDRRSGRIHSTKHRSSRHAAAESIRTAIVEHLEAIRAAPKDIAQLAHGTTLVTNLLVEHAGAKVGVITTRGFRDVLEIGRMRRPSLYDLNLDKPPPLAARACRLEVTERIDSSGQVMSALAEDEVRAGAAVLREQGVKAIAVCFLHSYANPAHEQRAAELLRELGANVCLSSEVSAEYGEFERFSTAVINAMSMPQVGHYFEELERCLRDLGIGVPLQVMQSNGGVISPEVAARFPVRLAGSGPAAGVAGAARLAVHAGIPRIVTFDMGGTSTDVGLAADGEVAYASEYHVQGYPVRSVGIDIRSIGAGGGSLAMLDRMGSLRVGPKSAGAEPGPACNGWGGSRPTVTDADLVLAFLSAGRFCGGHMSLREDLAVNAIETHIAGPCGVTVHEAAVGILRVAVTNMVGAVRNITMQQGHDPRDFVLVAYGGAGPVHAAFVAAELRIPKVLILRDSGLLSAKGLLLTQYRVDVQRTCAKVLDEVDRAELTRLFEALEESAVAQLSTGISGQPAIRVRRILEACYEGQQSTIPIDVAAFPVTQQELTALPKRLDEKFRGLFGFVPSGRRPQILHARVFAERDLHVGDLLQAGLAEPVRKSDTGFPAPTAERGVHYPESRGRIQVPVFERDGLADGDEIVGPAIIEEDYTNTVIAPGQSCRVVSAGNLLIDIAGAEAAPAVH